MEIVSLKNQVANRNGPQHVGKDQIWVDVLKMYFRYKVDNLVFARTHNGKQLISVRVACACQNILVNVICCQTQLSLFSSNYTCVCRCVCV